MAGHYIEEGAVEDIGEPPFVWVRLIHIEQPPPPMMPPGFLSGLKIVAGLSANTPPPSTSPPSADRPFFQTWVEMKTPTLLIEGEDAKHQETVWFERCLNQFNRMVRAYHFLVPARPVYSIRNVNRESLDPLAYLVVSEVDSDEPWAVGFLNLHANFPIPPEPATEEQERLINQIVDAQGDYHPFLRHREWLERAKDSRYRQGDYEEAVSNLQTSVECLMWALLRSVLVDKGLSVHQIEEQVKGVTGFASLMSTHLPRELRGNWNTLSRLPVGEYWKDLYTLRNRISHAGHSISYQEVDAAFTAYYGLVDFVNQRLLARPRVFPRTLLALLGEPGLKRRGAWTKFFERFTEEIAKEPNPFWWPEDARIKPRLVAMLICNLSGEWKWYAYDATWRVAAPAASISGLAGKLAKSLEKGKEAIVSVDRIELVSVRVEGVSPRVDPDAKWHPASLLLPGNGQQDFPLDESGVEHPAGSSAFREEENTT